MFFWRRGPAMNTKTANSTLKINLERLNWLTDAPLFIDGELVEQFFDAIVQPEFEYGHVIDQETVDRREKLKGELEASGEISLPSWLASFLNVKLGAKAGAAYATEEGSSQFTSVQKIPISNPTRKIAELTAHYLDQYPDRIIYLKVPLDPTNPILDDASEDLLKTPRILAFLDLPPRTKLIPTAAEFDNHHIELIFASLEKKWGSSRNPLPKYPDDPDEPATTLREERKKYWDEYKDAFVAQDAMVEVEKGASKNSNRIRWIDFRLPITEEGGNTMHLHICPRGEYDAGVFGYNFIKRGYKHGLRIVGTLKSEPDMNVMAIYEK